MGIRTSQGSIAFNLNGQVPDWTTNDEVYIFRHDGPPVQGVRLLARKNADGTLYIEANDHLEAAKFTGPVGVAAQGLQVAVSWNHGLVILYLDGAERGRVSCPGGASILN